MEQRAESAAVPTLGVGSSPDAGRSFRDECPELREFWDDFRAREWTIPEGQGEVYPHWYIVFKCPALSGGMGWGKGNAEKVIALAVTAAEEAHCAIPGDQRPHFGGEEIEKPSRNIYAPRRDENDPVLIFNIHGVELVDAVAPARFRLTCFDSVPDLFGSQLYKSSAQNVFFVVRPVDRELNAAATSRVTTDDGEIGVIQNAAEVVEGISQGEWDDVWRGFILLNRYGQIASFWVEAADQLEGALIEKGADQPVKIADMLISAV